VTTTVRTPRFGLQFTTHLANDHSVRELVRLADLAQQRGFHQVWINENIGFRSQAVTLSAIAASIPINIGTAITVPYFHHPLDVVATLTTLAELGEGRELCVGVARGDLGQADQHVQITQPLAMVEQFTRFARLAVSGTTVKYADFPVLQRYFNLAPHGRFTSMVPGCGRFAFFGGGNGPKALAATGRAMDGLLSSGTFLPLARIGRLRTMHRVAEDAAAGSQPGKKLRKVCELNVSLSLDRCAAIEFPKRQVAHSVLQWEALGFTDAEYAQLGVQRSDVLALQRHWQVGGTLDGAAHLVTDEMLHACYLAGTPEDVARQLRTYCALALELGYEQIIFAKLGPDYRAAIELLSEQILPSL
jgi:Coenzyme F420-dependent N5,N10-methylene tetrahydromethanopterin reductase and related flavin-dependent oxidoreductases